MNHREIIQKIMGKKEFFRLPEKDVEMAFGYFEKREVSDEEKIRLTRELLHKVFGAFASRKILSPKEKDAEWVLRKHLSTRERLPYYGELYKRIFSNFFPTSIPRPPTPTLSKKFLVEGLNSNSKVNYLIIFDLGAGVNGFSYNYLVNTPSNQSPSHPPQYVGVEAVGQLVDLTNSYFKKEKINGKAIHMSLFELDKLKKIIKNEEGKKIIFLFKTLDSLEMLERDYSKRLLKQIVPLVEKAVVSFATRSMISRKVFKAKRNWIIDYIKENFMVLDDFELGGERYIIFKRK